MSNYKHIKVDEKALAKAKKAILEKLNLVTLRELETYAKQMLRKAYLESEYSHNETQNLRDSYIWAIYYNGQLKKHGFIDNTPLATESIKKTATEDYIKGREEAEDFLEEYIPTFTKGWEVVFAATIYYGVYLENGTKSNAKYVVISSIYDEVRKTFGANKVRNWQNEYTYTR